MDAHQNAGKSEKWLEILKGILAGYESMNRLIPEEKRAFIPMLESIELLFAAYFLKINNPGLAENAAKMCKWVEQNKMKIHGVLVGAPL